MKLRVLGAIAAALTLLLIASIALASYPSQSIGQGSSDIWVMNLNETEDANVVATYIDQDGNPDASLGGTIDPLGNNSFPASSSGLGDNWLGSMVLFSDKPLASVAELHWQNVPTGDGWSGGAYVGYSEGANEIYVPGAAKTPSHRSIVTIQCVDTVDCEVSMTYRSVDGSLVAGGPFAETIEADSQESYDLHDPSLNPNIPTLPEAWYGTVRATSPQKIAGVIVNHTVYGYAVANNAIVPGDDTKIYFPALNKRNFGGEWMGQSDWSGFVVQNLSDVEITAYASLYGMAGGPPALTFSDTIPAYSSHGYNLRYGGDVDPSLFDPLGDVWLGTAIVSSTHPIVGSSSGVRYPGGRFGGAHLAVSSGANRLVFPVNYRVKNGATWLSESALGVQNMDPSSDVTVTLKYLNSDGTIGVQFQDTIPANSVHAYNTRYGGNTPAGPATFEPLGDSWAGAVVVETEYPSGEITGVATNQKAGPGYIYMGVYNSIAP